MHDCMCTRLHTRLRAHTHTVHTHHMHAAGHIIKVSVLAAKHLPKTDLMGKCDPYCIVKVIAACTEPQKLGACTRTHRTYAPICLMPNACPRTQHRTTRALHARMDGPHADTFTCSMICVNLYMNACNINPNVLDFPGGLSGAADGRGAQNV